MFEYLVDAFVPSAPGCGKPDMGWDAKKCGEFQSFLNARATQGWQLKFQEYREVKVQGDVYGNTRTQSAWSATPLKL